MNAVMQERERLSRDLHDGVAQLVGHLLLRPDTIKDLVASDRPREADAELERVRGVADEIYDDIGESIAGLRTKVAARGLVRALQEYAEQFDERHEIAVTVRSDDLADQFPPVMALQLFRLVFTVVGEADDAASARAQARALGPDIVLMDIDLPGEDSVAAARRLTAEQPAVTVAMLTVHDDSQALFEAIKAGAQGYLIKNARSRELLEQLQGLARGEGAMHPSLAASRRAKIALFFATGPSTGHVLLGCLHPCRRRGSDRALDGDVQQRRATKMTDRPPLSRHATLGESVRDRHPPLIHPCIVEPIWPIIWRHHSIMDWMSKAGMGAGLRSEHALVPARARPASWARSRARWRQRST